MDKREINDDDDGGGQVTASKRERANSVISSFVTFHLFPRALVSLSIFSSFLSFWNWQSLFFGTTS